MTFEKKTTINKDGIDYGSLDSDGIEERLSKQGDQHDIDSDGIDCGSLDSDGIKTAHLIRMALKRGSLDSDGIEERLT